MPTRRRRTRSQSTASAERGGYRPSARGSNSPRGRGESGGDGLDMFGQAVAGDATAPAEWSAVVSGQTLLKVGSRGAAVEHLQELLVSEGARITPDGIFGSGTRRALRARVARPP